ncbi:hypothetical protein ACFL0L_02280 [Patescibacteria group bacterium]
MSRVAVRNICIVVAILAAYPLLLLGGILASQWQPIVDSGYDPVNFTHPIVWWADLALFAYVPIFFGPLAIGEIIIAFICMRLLR